MGFDYLYKVGYFVSIMIHDVPISHPVAFYFLWDSPVLYEFLCYLSLLQLTIVRSGSVCGFFQAFEFVLVYYLIVASYTGFYCLYAVSYFIS